MSILLNAIAAIHLWVRMDLSKLVCLVASLVLCSCSSSPSLPATTTTMPDADGGAGSGFGNANTDSGLHMVGTLIDDGGATLLPDGAIIYNNLSARPCPPGNKLTYTTFADGFFSNYCRRCHSQGVQAQARNGAPIGLDYDSQALIVMHAAQIYPMAADENRTMPPAAPKPTDAERRQLGDWLACGAH